MSMLGSSFEPTKFENEFQEDQKSCQFVQLMKKIQNKVGAKR